MLGRLGCGLKPLVCGHLARAALHVQRHLRQTAQLAPWRIALMHPIWLAWLDKTRPVLVLTREDVREVRALVTVAPITSNVRGLSSEVVVRRRNSADHDSAVNIDLITTIPRSSLVRPIGMLLDDQEQDLARAFHSAFNLAP